VSPGDISPAFAIRIKKVIEGDNSKHPEKDRSSFLKYLPSLQRARRFKFQLPVFGEIIVYLYEAGIGEALPNLVNRPKGTDSPERGNES
jgi:hypothetical protein